MTVANPGSPDDDVLFRNFAVHPRIAGGKKAVVRRPLRMAEIDAALARLSPRWPKCGGTLRVLFVRGRDGTPALLPRVDALFAWLHGLARVEWLSGAGFILKKEFFEHLRITAEFTEPKPTYPPPSAPARKEPAR